MIVEEATLDIPIVEVLRDVLQQRGRVVVKPSGKSMGTRYRLAKSIVVEPMPAHAVPVGAVIVFPRHDYWVAHRVVAHRRRGGSIWYLTWGDAAGCPDALPLRHDIAVGVVTEIRGTTRTLNLRSTGQRVLARLRVVRILTAAVLRHPRVCLRSMTNYHNKTQFS